MTTIDTWCVLYFSLPCSSLLCVNPFWGGQDNVHSTDSPRFWLEFIVKMHIYCARIKDIADSGLSMKRLDSVSSSRLQQEVVHSSKLRNAKIPVGWMLSSAMDFGLEWLCFTGNCFAPHHLIDTTGTSGTKFQLSHKATSLTHAEYESKFHSKQLYASMHT